MSTLSAGLFLPSMSASGALPGDIAASARLAESLGFESAWVVDQLIAGTGTPLIESTVALAAAAGATSNIRLGLGVVIAPLRQTAWLAKQVQSLQWVSDNRLIFGVGAGGDRHSRSWAAAGVPRRERGKRTNAALAVLPDLIAGREAEIDTGCERMAVSLAPGVPVPPIVVGGMSEAAVRRAAQFADGWFLSPVPSASDISPLRERLAAEAARFGRPTPPLTASMMVALDGDPAIPSRAEVIAAMADPGGMFSIPADVAGTLLVTGTPGELRGRLAQYEDEGVERMVFTIAAGDWSRQAELIAMAMGEEP